MGDGNERLRGQPWAHRIHLAAVALTAALLLAAPSASAEPTATFKATAVPIRGWANTGNVLGGGASLLTELTISGTEYGGYPAPLEDINLFLPAGAILHPAGLPTCPKSELEPTGQGPRGCPKASLAGPVGVLHGDVAFGSKIVPETATVESFHAPGGGLEFYVFGHTPTTLEILSSGHYVSSSGLYSQELIAQMPLVETVPRAQDVSIESLRLELGSAVAVGGRTVYYLRLPQVCPTAGFPVKAELDFAGVGGLPEETVTKSARMRCPSRTLETPEPPPTQVQGTGGVITAPSNSACVSRRDFVIHVIQLKGVRYRRVVAAVNGRRIAVVSGSRTHARVDLKGLAKGTYQLRITVTTTTGRTISGTRTYHTCVPKRAPRGNPRL